MSSWSKLPVVASLVVLLAAATARAAPDESRDTDWLKDARYGVFMHLLPGNSRQLEQVKAFDTEALARQLEAVGARYFVITLGQNSGYFNAPNAAYDQITGYAPGERCATRDLPLDLYRALHPKGIKLMLYLPCQTPNEDRRAQKAFGVAAAPGDQRIDIEFARKWARVIREWSERYGDKVAGWWFDGGYDQVQFNEGIARVYADAVKAGNPHAIATFNPGVKLVRHTRAEDYTAGELNEPFGVIPMSRWVDGSQWHALTFLGSMWSRRDVRYPTEKWVEWVRAVVAHGGAVTLDMGPNWNPQAGPIGALTGGQVAQVMAIKAALTASGSAPAPQRIRRADAFLGVHFDFHAGRDCTEIGKNTTRRMVEYVLDQVHPDYLQIDCKGHPGLSSYPTKVGNQAPGFVGDPLRVWREVTAERGVGLFMHYSGVWDSEAIRKHSDWAVIDAKGKRGPNATSFFGSYREQLLVPQLGELAGDYGVDGAWVDGECWASQPDYGEKALAAFRKTTGIEIVPRQPGDPHWFEFLQFNRDAFRNYLRHYITEVKERHPEFQICSNWAFTDHMPEAVSAPVDWISGDFSPQDSVNSARLSGRYLVRQGKPWDLMAWSFTTTPGPGGKRQKTAVQLEREAAVVLALGGGFEAYFTQKRDGSVREEFLPIMAEVSRFCRVRQAICHHAMPVPQVALLYSTADHYRMVNGLFPRDPSRFDGTLEALLAAQNSVELVGEHQITGRMAEYPLIIVPECSYLEPAFQRELLDYARAGGKLLLIGPAPAALFRAELDVTPVGEPTQDQSALEISGSRVLLKGKSQVVMGGPKAQLVGTLFTSNGSLVTLSPAATITPVGKGAIAATYFDFSRGYRADRSEKARAFLDDLVRQLFPAPLVEVKGSADVDVSVNRKGGRLLVNLVNTAGPHADPKTPILETIPPVGPLQIVLRTPQAPKSVVVEPGGQRLPFETRDGVTRITLPRLEIHSVVAVD
jgi:hypothetical protein